MRLVLATLLLLIFVPSNAPHSGALFIYDQAQAQASKTEQKEAFESAKELGTIEAWEAFLNSYGDGFYADLARAYVKRLGQEPKQITTKQTASQPKAKPMRLATVSAEPGRTPWRNRRYEMDEGNSSAMAASVASDGVELLFHCDGRNRLAGILRETSRGKYPKFDERIRQGLDAKGGRAGGEAAFIPMEFSDGTVYSVAASVQELTGEVSLLLDKDGSGFRASGKFMSAMMTGQTVNIHAPPFSATLQLTNSRKALCAVVNKCGGGVSRCGRATRSATSRKNRYKQKRRPRKTKQVNNNPYLDSNGKLLDGYIYDKNGNITQDNGGGE